MSIGRLPEREQRILEEMERALRRDRRFQRRLRRLSRSGHSGRPGRLARAGRRPTMSRRVFRTPGPWAVALLLAVSVALMVSGITTSEPGVLWAFAAVWPLTLYAAFWLLFRRTER
ncbi:hypothetical protein [Streptomyces sp. NPDC005859]|uniref:hypothetical protein n=1 Tax=Streptomyces sp. NPDC005859 TaxID=3157170 RepID=UPI00340BF423